MEKVCVFCGERPISKTKEHVLPRWLLEMTGDPKRPLRIAFPYANTPTPDRTISYDYDSLHFPACAACNNIFSSLEGKAKPLVGTLLARGPLSALWHVCRRRISCSWCWLALFPSAIVETVPENRREPGER
jgi:hypothetical protein